MKRTRDAVHPRSGQRKTLTYRILDWITALLLSAGVICFLLFVVFSPVSVRSSGVSDFNSGDLVFADRLSKFVFGFSRGDPAVIKSGGGASSAGRNHIARVVALAGENVTVADGRVYINGSLLNESAYANAFDPELRLDLSIPQGSLLLLPDERSALSERDVRACIVKLNDIVGEVRFIAFPFRRIDFFR